MNSNVSFSNQDNSPNKVYSYYWQNFSQLPDYEKFHFFSRLYLVNNDKNAEREVEQVKKKFNLLSNEEVWQKLQVYLTNIAPITYQETRQKYLDKYPTIRPSARELFAISFGDKLFARDLSSFFSFSIEELTKTQEVLLEDITALKELSAFVTNFAITFTHFKNKHTDDLITVRLYEMANQLYDIKSSPKELEMWIYFLTHLIICDSLFYVAPMSEKKTEFYLKLLKEVETQISKNFLWVNLDCKLEFLVCSKLCNYSSFLETTIFSEADISLSSEGDFVVDVFNCNLQVTRTSFITSEHRNALYLMASSKRIKA